MDGTVLVADDDRSIRTVLTQALTRAGCKVHVTGSLHTLMGWLQEGRGDAVITDVMMPDGNGLELMPQIQAARPGLPVIVISAQNTIMTAVAAEEAGAFDYLPKPFDLPQLLHRTAAALSTRPTAPAPEPLPTELPLIGRSDAMQQMYRTIAKVVHADLPVLITGESGAGKSLVAQVLHDLSARKSAALVVLRSDELSDPVRCASAWQEAGQGSLVLDNIEQLSPEAQDSALRLLDRPGGPRILATTQVKVSELKLRDDLFYRLNGVTVAVPPLRDRPDDIALHVAQIIERPVTPEALDALRHYPWPGNLRQLCNLLRRMDLTRAGPQITAADVEAALADQPMLHAAAGAGALSDSVALHLTRYFAHHGDNLPPPGLYPRVLREFETPLIEIALRATGGNQARCAELLGINRNTLRKKIVDLGIEVTRTRRVM